MCRVFASDERAVKALVALQPTVGRTKEEKYVQIRERGRTWGHHIS
jgi:hypothetical protein